MALLSIFIVDATLVLPLFGGASSLVRGPLRSIAPWTSFHGGVSLRERRAWLSRAQNGGHRHFQGFRGSLQALFGASGSQPEFSAASHAAVWGLPGPLGSPTAGIVTPFMRSVPPVRATPSEQSSAPALDVCPGQVERIPYTPSSKCEYEASSTMCMQLLDEQGKPLNWGDDGNFWDITNQRDWMWDNEIRKEGGDSWCVTLKSAAMLIRRVGCENVHIRCDATDVSRVREEIGFPYKEATDCLTKKCYSDVSLVSFADVTDSWRDDSDTHIVGIAAGAVGAVLVILVARQYRSYRGRTLVEE